MWLLLITEIAPTPFLSFPSTHIKHFTPYIVHYVMNRQLAEHDHTYSHFKVFSLVNFVRLPYHA